MASNENLNEMENTYHLIGSNPSVVSMAVIPIFIYCVDSGGAEILLGKATAYCDRFDDKKFLITNWHCVTGRDPATGQPKSSDCVVPTFIRAYFHELYKENGFTGIKPYLTKPIDFPVDGRWIMHHKGQNIDICAVLIDGLTDDDLICMADAVKIFDPVVACGDEVFVLGFPKGITPTGTLPIWKRASIASETQLKAFGEECYIVDAATREGMSGSPVIGRLPSKAIYNDIIGNGPITKNSLINYKPGFSFLGVYSGRIGVGDLLEAQIGKVWHPKTVNEMLMNPRELDWESR